MTTDTSPPNEAQTSTQLDAPPKRICHAVLASQGLPEPEVMFIPDIPWSSKLRTAAESDVKSKQVLFSSLRKWFT
jgi:hypothetical protein